MNYNYRPVVLVILDGWGVAPDSDGNAITRAELPNYRKFLENYPAMTLYASGTEVGLMFGEMGNSEVGHLNIGAGRVYYQTLPRIAQAIGDDSFKQNPAFLSAFEHVKKYKSRLHFLGLVSNGKVHASDEHLYSLLALCQEHGLSEEVFIHAILDGRDCVYNSGRRFVERLLEKMAELKVGALASLCGRYYAMDRDGHWDRCEKAYRAIAEGRADRQSDDPLAAIDESYNNKNYDEEFIPTVITKKGQPLATVRENDALIFFNFRSDRARQMTKAFVLPSFNKFTRAGSTKNLFFVTMVEYEKELPVIVAFPPLVVHDCLAEAISKAGKKQFHIAETEKYAHITFFLNGTVEDAFPGEERMIVPSPKVASYDQTPEMSAPAIVKETIRAVNSGQYDFIVVNLANPDMIGHTGNLTATIKAVEIVDKCLGEIVDHVLARNSVALVTGDHGNAEEIINLQTGEIDKEHSANPVPLLILGRDFLGQAGPAGDAPEGDLSLLRPVGMLADVAPTVLKLMDLEQPPAMTGQALM